MKRSDSSCSCVGINIALDGGIPMVEKQEAMNEVTKYNNNDNRRSDYKNEESIGYQ